MATYNVIDPSYEDNALVEGTESGDSIYSSGDNSTINALGGNDFVQVYGNFSVVNAGSGKDIVSLNGGRHDSGIWLDGDEANEVYGGNGNDSIYVQSRGASIYGEGGNDTINIDSSHVYANGGEGNDVFYYFNNGWSWSEGKDNITITGGAGSDKFILEGENPKLQAVITDFSAEDVFRFQDTDYSNAYASTYSNGTKSYGRKLTQHVENGNVIINDNVSVSSSGNDILTKNVEPNLSITLQGVSDISEIADAKYYLYSGNTPIKQSTLAELFGVESTTTTSTSTEDTTTSTTTSTTSTSTEDTTTSTTTSTTSTTSTSTEDTTTSTTTSTTSTSTEDTTTSTTTSTTTGDTYNINDNNGTFVNQSSVSGGVTNTSNVDNSQNSVVSDNTWNYSGSTSTTPSTSAVTTTTSTTPSTSAVTTTTSTTPATPTVINNYYGDTYNIDDNNGAVVIGSNVTGGVTNNTNIDNSKNIVISGNTWTYSGGDKVINNYQQGEVVRLESDYQGIDLQGNSFFVKSSSGSLEIENARDKFIGYGAGSDEVAVYSYVASGSGAIDGSDRSQAEMMIGAENSDNQIYAGSGGSSMWGGMGGNDIMTGGAGYDEYFYFAGCGNDNIMNCGSNDLVNLSAVSVSQVSAISMENKTFNIQLNDGSSLHVQSESQSRYLIEGYTLVMDHNTGSFV